MTERIIQGGCTAPKPAPLHGKDRFIAFGYGVVVALTASLISLTAAVHAGPFIGPIQWFYSQPVVAVLAAVSMHLYRYYRTTETWLASTSFVFLNAVMVAAVSLLVVKLLPIEVPAW